jgi:hypothetical protein
MNLQVMSSECAQEKKTMGNSSVGGGASQYVGSRNIFSVIVILRT